MASIFILFGFGIAFYATYVLVIWLTAWLTGVPRRGILRAFAVVFAMAAINVLTLAALFATREQLGLLLLVSSLGTVIGLVAPLVLPMVVMRAAFWQAAICWVAMNAAGGGLAFVSLLGMRLFLVEAFIIPTHSMAPTLLGPHQRDICPQCGGTITVPAPIPDQFARNPDPNREELAMCIDCQQAILVKDRGTEVFPGDRLLVNKLLTPRRWDLVAFRYPPDPEKIYVDRLVGLPGDEVFIKEGAIWINEGAIWVEAERQTPPADIAKLTFTTKVDGGMEMRFGRPEEPFRLKDNELFVLGDFALRSSDSRDWGPVPVENVIGVVDLIYWPPERWRLLR